MAEQFPTKKKAVPGWYADPKDSTAMRRWDGDKWLDEYKPRKPPKQPWSPGDYFSWAIGIALIGGIIAGGITAGDDELGGFAFIALVTVGSIFLSIGVVAKGVEAGIRASKREPS